MDKKLLEIAKEFHGHAGPFLALGLRIGIYAMEYLHARKYFGIKVVVKAPPNPPASCIIDGLQISTGATYGKRNIELLPAQHLEIEFLNTDTGSALKILIPERIRTLVINWLNELGEEKATYKAYTEDGLFEIINVG